MIALRTLGSLEIVGHDGVPVDVLLAQPKRAALLTYVAVAGGRTYVRRDLVLGLFWPEQDDHRARGALRQALYAVRQDLGSDVIGTRGDEEVRVRPESLSCDVLQFDAAIRSNDLEGAAGLYGGPFLAGFYLRGYPEFARWAEAERERCAAAYGKALEKLVARAAERRDWSTAVDWCRLLATHNPYSTSAVLTCMEAMAAAGNRAGALRCAEQYTARIREELCAAPSPEVSVLAQRLRNEAREATAGRGSSSSSGGVLIAARGVLVEALFRAARENSRASVMLHQAIGDRLGLASADTRTLEVLERLDPPTPGDDAPLPSWAGSFRQAAEALANRYSDEELVVIADFLRRNGERVRNGATALPRARKRRRSKGSRAS